MMDKPIIVLDVVNSTYGAPMGRNDTDSDVDLLPDGAVVYLAEVPFVYGDYDIGGVYWGSNGSRLWVAQYGIFGEQIKDDMYVRIFERAADYKQAVQRMQERFLNNVRFVPTETNTWRVLAGALGAEIYVTPGGDWSWRMKYEAVGAPHGFDSTEEAYNSLLDYCGEFDEEDDDGTV